MSIFHDNAPALWAAGLSPLPLRRCEKRPAINGWSEFCSAMPDEKMQGEWLKSFPDGNIGLALGSASGLCAIDIDSDDPALIAAIEEALPHSPWHRVGKKGKVMMFRFDGQKPFKLKSEENGMLCELLSGGNQVVLPPSIHPDTQQPYTANVELLSVLHKMQSLPKDVEKLIRKALAECGYDLGKKAGAKRAKGAGSDLIRFPGTLPEQVEAACAHLREVKEGDRNNALFNVALPLAHGALKSGADWAEVSAQLVDAALSTGTEGVEETLASAMSAASKAAWRVLAEDWAYIAQTDTFHHLESGTDLSPRAFDREFSSRLSEGGSMAAFLTSNDHIRKFHGLGFDPTASTHILERNGRLWVNTYRPSDIVAVAGDPAPFIAFLDYLLPVEEERNHLVKVLAHLVRFPGVKIHHAVVLGSRAQGIGKSTLVELIMKLFGRHNCRKATHRELVSDFQSFFDRKGLVLVEELNLATGKKDYNTLKDMITGPTFPMNRKGRDVEEVDNFVNFFFLTNMNAPILLEPSDRRFAIFDSPATPRSPNYYKELHDWLAKNAGVVRSYLDNVDLSDFDPHAPPPMTEAKRQLISKSYDPVSMLLRELIAGDARPFHRDILMKPEIELLLQRHGHRLNARDLLRVLDEIGAENLGQHRVRWDKVRTELRFVADGNERPFLWVVRNGDYWKQAPAAERVAELLAEQGKLWKFRNLEELGVGLAYDPFNHLPDRLAG